ncbi:hypothetical protein CGRA01v4_03616 [Colletotrichum graminicola]|nr:hypothetical protein CGRA01v4_03616 [Colletotrichum graminicola]
MSPYKLYKNGGEPTPLALARDILCRTRSGLPGSRKGNALLAYDPDLSLPEHAEGETWNVCQVQSPNTSWAPRLLSTGSTEMASGGYYLLGPLELRGFVPDAGFISRGGQMHYTKIHQRFQMDTTPLDVDRAPNTPVRIRMYSVAMYDVIVLCRLAKLAAMQCGTVHSPKL